MGSNQGRTASNRLGWANNNAGSGGGGGGITSLPVGNFVFVNPLGNDGTGAREDESKPFLTLNAAKNAAISGDTILVYGGVYNEANQLHKDGVKWDFMGLPTLNLLNSFPFSDGGLDTTIEISGNAIINHTNVGAVLHITGANTIAHVNFHKVTTIGEWGLALFNGSGVINIETQLTTTLVNRCIQLEGNASYTINIDDIFGQSTVGGGQTIHPRGGYTGFTVINATTIRNNNTKNCIEYDYSVITGTVVFNVTDKIYKESLVATSNLVAAVNMYGGNAIINGNIDGGVSVGISLQTNNFTRTLTHNGNATNDGSHSVVDMGADAGFWAGGNTVTTLNGTYTGSNEKVIQSRGVTLPKIIIDGEIKSIYAGVGINYGLFLGAGAGATLLNTLKIVSDLGGTPNGIGATVNKDIKIINNVSSNVDVDANINNLIAANNYTFDTDIE